MRVAPQECLVPRGRVEVFTSRGAPKLNPKDPIANKPGFPAVYKSCDIDFSEVPLLDQFERENIIFNQGKDRVIESLTTGFINVIARMAVGDRGTIPSDSTVPKVPTADLTGLYNEVYRDDVDATVLDVGNSKHEVKFIKTFSALVIPEASFSNQANPVVNEVGLITADLLGGEALPRDPVAAPDSPDSDESVFSLRAFKSVPFEAANEISITIRYTIYIE